MPSNELLVSFLPMLVALAIIYFLMIRPQKNREKEVQAMRDNLKQGDEIITVGGIKGIITKLGQDYITIETSGHTRIELTRSAVYKVLTADDRLAKDKLTSEEVAEENI